MKKLFGIVLFITVFTLKINAQYYESANAVVLHPLTSSNAYTHLDVMTVDFLGRSIYGGHKLPCTFCYEEGFFYLPGGTGKIKGKIGKLHDIATDGSGNVYVAANAYTGTIEFDSIHSINDNGNAMYFIVKFNVAGNYVWSKLMPGNFKSLAVNNAGTILYAACDTIVLKMNAQNGNNSLPPKYITGGKLTQDASSNCYILGTNTLTKLRKADLSIAWTRNNAGGNDIYSGNTNNIYVVSAGSVKKITSANSVLFTYPAGGNCIVANTTGEFYIGATDGVHKINSTGTTEVWYRGNSNVEQIALHGTDEIYIGGTCHLDNGGIMLCPFHLYEQDAGDNDCGYLAKINEALPMPFQANIITHAYDDGFGYLCNGNTVSVTYDVCLNETSQFAPDNTFYVMMYGSFAGSPINIGPAGNAVIPDSIPSGYCNFQVNSTNPPIEGEITYIPWALDYYYESYSSNISVIGPSGLCVNGSVKIKVDNVPYQYKKWYINGVQDYNLDDEDTITVTSACNVYCVISGACGAKTSNTIYVTNTVPVAPIAALGSTTFCAGDSVKLVTSSCANCTYKWKKNNVVIAGATTTQYYAKTAGNYKVTITGPNGCSKTSAPIAVTVNCREAGSIISDYSNEVLGIYPNPVSNLLNIHSEFIAAKGLITIRNIFGQEVYNKTFDDNTLLNKDLDVSNLAKGIYILSLYSGDEVYSVKFVKQ